MESINERKAFRLSVIIVLLIAVIACMIISLISYLGFYTCIASRDMENVMV